jgi:hypothetical protein
MSHPVPRQQSLADAARSDAPSTPPVDRPVPEFLPHVPPPGPHSGIEREIERSERASAALAATRALARAAFTDSQLAAEDAAGDDDIDTSGWIRTEYAALDHPVREPQDDAARAAATRNLVGGSFNPGIASMHGRTFPGASPGQAPIRTRTGAQARFLHESRQTPRPERGTGAPGHAHYDKPAVMPMLAPATTPGSGQASAAAPLRARVPAGEPFKFVLAAGLGAGVVLMFGGVAWQAGWLSRNSASNADLVTARVAAQAEAARVLSAPPQDVAIEPGAGATRIRTNAEVDAALAAVARAAAVPVASVHAAGPSRALRPASPVAPAATSPLAVVPAAVSTTAPTPPQRAPVMGKDGVAEAVVRAQARADNFLASGSGGATAPAAATDVKPQP